MNRFPQKKHQLLSESLLLVIYRIHLLLGGIVFLACYPAVQRIELHYVAAYDDSLLRYILLQCLVDAGHFRILRCIDYRLPSELRQIFAELDPSLYSGASCRRPVVCYDKNLLHKVKGKNFLSPPVVIRGENL